METDTVQAVVKANISDHNCDNGHAIGGVLALKSRAVRVQSTKRNLDGAETGAEARSLNCLKQPALNHA